MAKAGLAQNAVIPHNGAEEAFPHSEKTSDVS